jgi:UDP-hydrolysing UDP-N-acetyl-D-glucosamine 2-epimerase
MNKRRVAIFTGNRAEYGLQYPILQAVNDHPNLDYRLIVSGAHLDKNFGNTRQEINNDGFRIDSEVRIQPTLRSAFTTAEAIGIGITEMSKALAIIRPNILVVYADRFEGFAAVIASSQMNIPTAHIEGGDLTEGGALDDSVRHAMTKLSHLHFTTNKQATNRILAMGEEKWRVHTVGLPSLDLIKKKQFADSEEVKKRLNLDLSRPIAVFTQHSVTTEHMQAISQLKPSLNAIRGLAKEGVQVVLTYPNNDVGGIDIVKSLEQFADRGFENISVHKSLGRHLYHGVLALARKKHLRVVCIGNSSSGIKETPAFSCPTVNIGSRQQGRLRGSNVLDTGYNADEITNAVRYCLFDDAFRESCRKAKNPYWMGGAGAKIASVLADVPLDSKLIRKRMMLAGETKQGWYR